MASVSTTGSKSDGPVEMATVVSDYELDVLEKAGDIQMAVVVPVGNDAESTTTSNARADLSPARIQNESSMCEYMHNTDEYSFWNDDSEPLVRVRNAMAYGALQGFTTFDALLGILLLVEKGQLDYDEEFADDEWVQRSLIFPIIITIGVLSGLVGTIAIAIPDAKCLRGYVVIPGFMFGFFSWATLMVSLAFINEDHPSNLVPAVPAVGVVAWVFQVCFLLVSPAASD